MGLGASLLYIGAALTWFWRQTPLGAAFGGVGPNPQAGSGSISVAPFPPQLPPAHTQPLCAAPDQSLHSPWVQRDHPDRGNHGFQGHPGEERRTGVRGTSRPWGQGGISPIPAHVSGCSVTAEVTWLQLAQSWSSHQASQDPVLLRAAGLVPYGDSSYHMG